MDSWHPKSCSKCSEKIKRTFIILKNTKKYLSTRTWALGTRTRLSTKYTYSIILKVAYSYSKLAYLTPALLTGIKTSMMKFWCYRPDGRVVGLLAF